MRYDHLGFPIPQDFEPPEAGGGGRRAAERRRSPGRGKRLIVLALLATVIVPGILSPAALPAIRECVVRWSVQRAFTREARGESAAAVRDVGRALSWSGEDGPLAMELLCWRASLRLDAGDAAGAAEDARRAIELVPTASRPRCVRALVHVVLGRPDEALADAEAAVALAGPSDPEALNHRAYIRALVGRDLPGALADIDAALADGAESTPEFLDTRAYVLHLLGRDQEAVDLLNLAIAGTEERRRDLVVRSRLGDRVGVARELRSLDHGLAVMHEHRGLACRALGLERQAEQDFAIARQKGFDPSRGVM